MNNLVRRLADVRPERAASAKAIRKCPDLWRNGGIETPYWILPALLRRTVPHVDAQGQELWPLLR